MAKHNFITKHYNLTTLLYLALILALVSSLAHVAFAFSTVNGGNDTEAYISAIAIDLGLLTLAAGINSRKRQRRKTWTLWAGVILFSIISTYANWLAGITHVTPLPVEVSPFAAWLVSLRPILLSGVLPLLVIYLSEIVSGNYNQSQKDDTPPVITVIKNEPEQVKLVSISHLEEAHEAKTAKKKARQEQVYRLTMDGKSQSEIAKELSVSLTTIKRDAAALNGKLKAVSQ